MREHGTRAKYVWEKCRCDACRKANRDYANERLFRAQSLAKLIETQPFPAERVWHYTKKGSKKGTSSPGIANFKRMCPGFDGKPCVKGTYLRKDSKGGLCGYCREHVLSTYQSTLARKARMALKRLSKQGDGLRTVQALIGVSRSTLHKIRNGTARRIANDIEAAILQLLEKPQIPDKCEHCGLSHKREDRLPLIRRMLPCTYTEIREMYPCIYGTGFKDAGSRKLSRDLVDVAVLKGGIGGTWYDKEEVHVRAH